MMSARFARAGLRATQQFSAPRTAAVNCLRSYATPAQEVRPPVALFGVDGTYATALVCNSIALQLSSRPCLLSRYPSSPEAPPRVSPLLC
jgi:hypothetical protein